MRLLGGTRKRYRSRPQHCSLKLTASGNFMPNANTQKTSVLIVGAGPVGLALAVELGWRGVNCMVVEQTDGTITTPKMNEVNARTMEFCRRWGMADEVLNCPFPGDHPLDT